MQEKMPNSEVAKQSPLVAQLQKLANDVPASEQPQELFNRHMRRRMESLQRKMPAVAAK